MKEFKENNKIQEGIDKEISINPAEKEGVIMEKYEEKLFETKKEISKEEIKAMGRYPLLETLVVLKSPDNATIKKLEENVLAEAASAVSLDSRKLRIKDVNMFGPLLVQMLKEGNEKGALEINKDILESLLLKSGYKSLDEFSPEKQKELETMRTLCQTIIDNRDLLDRCIKPYPKCGWTLKDNLPLLVKDAGLKAGLNLDEEEIKKYSDSFVNIKNLAESKECQAILNYYYEQSDAGWEHDCKRKNLYGVLCEYANNYFQTEYLGDILYKVKEIIKLYFPEIFKDLPAKMSMRYQPRLSRDFEKMICTWKAVEEAGYFLKTSRLEFFSSVPLNNRRNYGEMEIDNPFFSKEEIQEKNITRLLKKNRDFMALTHEYLHYLFVEISNLPDDFLTSQGEINPKYQKINCPYNTLMEGEAVLLEMLVLDFLKRDALKLGLSKRDIEDFENRKKGRLHNLKAQGRGTREVEQEIAIAEDPQKREQRIKQWREEKDKLEKARPAGVYPKDYSEQPRIQELEKDIELWSDPVKIKRHIQRRRQEIFSYNAYYEGTLNFFHKLYKKEGLSGTLNFIKNLDAEKILSVDRESEEYKEMLNNPDLFVKKFTRAPEQTSAQG